MSRNIAVTSALPYANGPIHIGHLVEYIQTDIWVKFQKLNGNRCHYFCADDTHGTAIMISARNQGITPEELIERVHAEHYEDFKGFHIEFDNYYSTHSPENREFSELIFSRLNEKGSIAKRTIAQAYCDNCKMFLPDRYIRGECPRCHAQDQYGDSCEVCSGTHSPTELINPKCSQCGNPPVRKESKHYFFKLADYENQLRDLIDTGHTHKSVANKLDEWFSTGLKDWDISRDGPYFGFKIPGEDDKYFYVWLDAPIGYMASAKNYCEKNNMDFDELWNGENWELYHFIGKDIMYFHALFWPAMLMGSGFKTANNLFVHGFLTVDGEKMSKSRGTFIKAATYLKHLDPEYLRYYYASKLTAAVEDIDLSIDDFINKINSDLVGKLTNLASRSGPMIGKKFDYKLCKFSNNPHVKQIIDELVGAKNEVIESYENLNYASVIRKVTSLAGRINVWIEQNKPWEQIKDAPDAAHRTLSLTINAVKILTIYLKPILPKFAEKIEKFLNVDPLCFEAVDKILEDRTINKFERLFERIDKEKVEAMIDESKDSQAPASSEPAAQASDIEPIAPECTIDDFAKVDLRIAIIKEAKAVEGADKLLQLTLDVGCMEKNVFAGIAKAYKPEELVGKTVICVANLKPRKMKFGVSEGMILAAGAGGNDLFMLTTDPGTKPGQRIS